jgi:hypothetical protein
MEHLAADQRHNFENTLEPDFRLAVWLLRGHSFSCILSRQIFHSRHPV